MVKLQTDGLPLTYKTVLDLVQQQYEVKIHIRLFKLKFNRKGCNLT